MKTESDKLLSDIRNAGLSSEKLFYSIKGYKVAVMNEFICHNADRNHDASFMNGALVSKHPLFPLGDITDIALNRHDPSIFFEHESSEGKPFFEEQCIIDLRLSEDGCRKLKADIVAKFPDCGVLGADILMVGKGDKAGASAIVPIFHFGGVLGQNLIRLRLHSDSCEVFYLLNVLHYYYNAGFLKTHLASSGDITFEILSDVMIPIPPVGEQKKITGVLLELSRHMVLQESNHEEMKNLSNIVEAG